MHFDVYYKDYWIRRFSSQNKSLPPIRNTIPKFLVRYSGYGAVLCRIEKGIKVIDVGCGDGSVSSLFIKKGCSVYGIDISEEVVKLAQSRGIKAQVLDMNKAPLPFDSGSFEAVTIIDVLEHVIDPLSLLKECRRILKEEGKIILSIPNFARWCNRIKMLCGCPKDILHWGDYGDDLEHLHWFTKPKIKYILNLVGFKKVKFYPIGLPFGFVFGLAGCYGLANWLLVEAKKQ